MEHSNQVGSYTVPHKSIMAMLSDSVMARLSQPDEPEAPSVAEQPAQAPMHDSFYFRSRNKRCGCAQCKAVRAAM